MPKSKPTLPTDTKLDYTTIEGAPTIIVAASLTTRTQVEELTRQLERLALVLPEAKVRKARKTAVRTKPTNGPRKETTQENLV